MFDFLQKEYIILFKAFVLLFGGLAVNKKRIFEIIQVGEKTDYPSRIFDITLAIAIFINIIIAALETYEEMSIYHGVFYTVEFITVIFFTVEYILRVWTADYLYPHKSRGKAVLKYMFSFSGIIDLLSFLPFYMPFFMPSGMSAFRIFRIVRILRLFQLNKYYDSLNLISDVLKSKKKQLGSSVFLIFVLMLAASLMMYSFEHEAQPEVFENIFSGFWWAASTLLTVGYGDIYPITLMGRLFGTAITFLGVLLVAVPTGVLSAGFVEQVQAIKGNKSPAFCPHCGKKLPDMDDDE